MLQIRDGVVIDHSQAGWPEFRNWIDGTYARLRYVWSSNGTDYTILALDGAVRHLITLPIIEATEFEASFQVSQSVEPRSYRSDGVQRVQLEPSSRASSLRIRGFKLVAALRPSDDPNNPEQASHVDVAFDLADEQPAIDFQGLEGVWVADHLPDDRVEAFAAFPGDGTRAQWDALGLGAWPYGVHDTPADAGVPDGANLKQFGVSVYLPPDGRIPPIVGEGSMRLGAPIVLRCCYFATGVDGVDTVPRLTGMVRYWYGLA